jgi:hypothetical protein
VNVSSGDYSVMAKKIVWMVQMKKTALKVRKFLNKWVNAPVSYFTYLGYKLWLRGWLS